MLNNKTIDDMIDRWIDIIQMNDVTIPSIAPTAANDDDGDDANIKLLRHI